ncbi:hypothetical protein QUF50_00705, partial [Thiotrichales bacterium HSG1]|nr:hypothetical protein [Thiotrichales bacterium HSG1]
MDNSKTCTATFQQQYSLAINVTGQGTVKDCGNSCNNVYLKDEVIMLTAIPATDWQLSNWTGDCNSSGVVIMDDAQTCTAVFKQIVVPNIPEEPVVKPDDKPEENIAGEVVNKETLEDITVEPDATITGGTVAGEVVNEGTLENITVDRRALI